MNNLTMIVPVFNGMKFIDAFIQPFNRYEYSWDIIFVDNGSDDGSLQYLEDICAQNSAWQVLLFSDKQSSYAARNCGVSKSDGQIFLFTDIDCILTESYFDFIRAGVFNEDSLISGPTNIFLETHNIYEYFDQCTYLTQESYSKQNYAATANLIVGRALYEKAGGFPEFTSGADNKFCKICLDKGGQLVFYSALLVLHPPRGSLREHLVKAKRLGIGHGETYSDQNMNVMDCILDVAKQSALIFVPIHSARLFLRVFRKRGWDIINLLKLLRLCIWVVTVQRINIIKTVVKLANRS